jgi:hypothetical protein
MLLRSSAPLLHAQQRYSPGPSAAHAPRAPAAEGRHSRVLHPCHRRWCRGLPELLLRLLAGACVLAGTNSSTALKHGELTKSSVAGHLVVVALP